MFTKVVLKVVFVITRVCTAMDLCRFVERGFAKRFARRAKMLRIRFTTTAMAQSGNDHDRTIQEAEYFEFTSSYFDSTSIAHRVHFNFTSSSIRFHFEWTSNLGGRARAPPDPPIYMGGLPPPHTLLLFTSAFGPPDRNSTESRQSCLRIKDDYH